MTRRPTVISLMAALALLGTACGGSVGSSDPFEDAFPIVANADLAVGSQRLLVGLVTPDAVSYASADLPVVIDLYPPDATEPAITVPGVFTWTTPEVRGLYRAVVELDRAGMWEVGLRTESGDSSGRTPFNVAEVGLTPGIGEAAPPVATPTGAEVSDLAEISTDPEPDPRFYRLSLDEGLASGIPTVVVFATPAFCETATCGPMLDTVKEVSSAYPDLNFIHVEVYENLQTTSRDELVPVEAVQVWRLPSEPWIFVVDTDGKVAARFEGTVDRSELTEVLDNLS